MQQYFVEEDLQRGTKVKLNEEQSHHIQHVLRMKANDIIRIANHQGVVFQAHVEMDGKVVMACLDELLEENPDSLEITLAQGLIKGEKWDYLIQKVCELGVTTIQPVMMQRCVVKVKEEKSDKKLQRWNKIALEACEQCKRATLVHVEDVCDLKTIADQEYDLKLLAFEGADHKAMKLKDTLSNYPDLKRVLCMIGPEGGFEDKEVTYLLDHGFVCVSLGKRILRAETAALAMVHSLTYTYDC